MRSPRSFWAEAAGFVVFAVAAAVVSNASAGPERKLKWIGDYGTREFFTHVRFHKHDDDNRITVHLLVELYARSAEEATDVLEEAARGALTITSLAEESRPPAATGDDRH